MLLLEYLIFKILSFLKINPVNRRVLLFYEGNEVLLKTKIDVLSTTRIYEGEYMVDHVLLVKSDILETVDEDDLYMYGITRYDDRQFKIHLIRDISLLNNNYLEIW